MSSFVTTGDSAANPAPDPAPAPSRPASPLLEWAPIGTDDIPRWHRLVEAVIQADDGQEHLTTDDLADELGTPWLDPVADTVLGVDTDGVARAFGTVDLLPGDTTLLRVRCGGAVDPEWRGRGIGREVIAWQLRRARELVAARRADLGGAVPARAQLQVDEGVPTATRLAERAGLAAVRYFFVMRRPLDGSLPEVAVPDGLRLVPFDPALDDAVRLAHNDAFGDHWGFQPWTATMWQQWETGHRDFRPDWSFLLLDGDEVAGYALSAGYQADWEAQGYTEGWTGKLGVRRAWRGRGGAKALLAASMRAFQADGIEYAGLDVDSGNPTGAVSLYTGLGYQVRRRYTMHALDL